MSKILIIPDVHGRDFWMEPCQHVDEYDKIIFLGDYHDPYLHQVDRQTSRIRLQENLVPFVKNNTDKVVCLYGNHDCYIVDGYCCRHDLEHYDEIKGLLEQMNLQLYYEVDGYLFTHAGVTPAWLKSRNFTLADFKKLPLSDYAINNDVSEYRGGYGYGSPIWGDVREFIHLERLPERYQIFGHTQLDKEIITDKYACLDCRRVFELNTETNELNHYENFASENLK